MIKLNKNKFGFLNNNLVLLSMIIGLISFPFLSYAGGASMHSPIEQFVVKKIFEIQDPFFGYDISFTNANNDVLETVVFSIFFFILVFCA